MTPHPPFAQAEPPPAADGPALAGFLQEFWPVLVPVALGLAAVYLLLPRARRYPPVWGGLLGGLAVVVAGWWLIHFEADSGKDVTEAVLFYAFAGLAVLSAGLMVAHSNPVYAALSFAMVVLSTCGLFLLLGAPFLTAATVIVYAGAIVVTFLFVIMLAQQMGYSGADQRSREPFLASLAAFVLLAAVLCVLYRTYREPEDRAQVRQRLEGLLDQTRRAKDSRNIGELRAVIGDGEAFFAGFHRQIEEEDAIAKHQPAATLEALTRELDLAAAAWRRGGGQHPEWGKPWENTVPHLRNVYREGRLVLARLQTPGALVPDPELPASPYGVPPQQEGRAEPGKVPAENVAGLGRALFTDYLLAVEAAGLLLLVATVGAIAIAARAREGLR
jgi:NADH:ubiquinone oxidoreductase subunit 6 (subunit J)